MVQICVIYGIFEPEPSCALSKSLPQRGTELDECPSSMSRKSLIRSKQFPYHVTGRVNNREWFPLHLEDVWQSFLEETYASTLNHGVLLHSLVLMSNHFHMKLSTPESDLGNTMRDYLGSLTRNLNRKSGRSGHIFTGRYRWSLIGTADYYSAAYKYVYRNPVKAGICERVEDYPYSTLNVLTGQRRTPLPLSQPLDGAGDLMIPDDPVELLRWLNQPYSAETDRAIAFGVRKKTFRFPKDRIHRVEYRPQDL